jgi:hypothetical protein
MLSYTFMTDVPVLTAMVWSMLGLVRAVQRKQDRWLIVSVLFACMAAGIRLVGLVTPVAMLLVLLFHSGQWGRYRGRFLLAGLAPFVFMAMLLWWYKGRVVHITDMSNVMNAPITRIEYAAKYSLQLLPVMLGRTSVFVIGTVGLTLAPLTAGCINRTLLTRTAALPVLFLLAFGCFFSEQNDFLLLAPGSTWAIGELGATEHLTPDYEAPHAPVWLSMLIITPAFISGAIWAATLLRRRCKTGESVILWNIAGHFLLIALLWLIFDRYALPLMMLGIVSLLASGVRVRRKTASALLVLIACISIVGLRDHLAYNQALWQAVERLRSIGAQDVDIDGGYAVNGWLQYAHPQNAPRDAAGRILVSSVNANIPSRYRISNATPDGWRCLEKIPYQRWLGRPGGIYILEQENP